MTTSESPRAVKLTKSMREWLSVIPDWSAPYEGLGRLGRPQTHHAHGQAVAALDRLCRKGLAQYSTANGTYRITETGRTLLQEASSNE